MNKINTKNNPEFLELGTKHNDQIVLMKELERIEEGIDKLSNIMIVLMGVLMGAVLVAVVFS